MISLAMEMPTCRLAQWEMYTDLDFVLAHKVLADRDYAEHFKHRTQDRELILDNSFHELGHPLDVRDLLRAAVLCRATYIIAPDKVGDVAFNIEQLHKLNYGLFKHGVQCKTAVVMTGTEEGTKDEREDFLQHVRNADMLCCTFKQAKRYDWYFKSKVAREWKRVHLLGVSELIELGYWQVFSHHNPQVEMSVDTGKPLKWALQGKRLDELRSLRFSEQTTAEGKPSIMSQKILELCSEDVTPEIDGLFRYNATILRKKLGLGAKEQR